MIKLVNGDCLEVMGSMRDNTIDLILTDIPYGTTNCKWDNVIPFDKMWEQIDRLGKENSAKVLFGNEPFSSYLRISNIQNYKYDWVWDKVNKFTNALNHEIMPMRDNELISVFYNRQSTYNKQLRKGSYTTRCGADRGTESTNYVKPKSNIGKKVNGLNPKRIISFPAHMTKGVYHPTQKPVALMEYLVKTYSNEGDIVLDFTMGSGTTGIACRNLNRNFIGIDNGYCEKKKVVNGIDLCGLPWKIIAELRLEGII